MGNLAKFKNFIFGLFILALLFGFSSFAPASERDDQLYQAAFPYIKYFKDRALNPGLGFSGLTRSFQVYLGNHTPEEEAVINYAAASYDQSILARICLAADITTILDTYVSYFHQLSDPNNPLFKCSDDYYDAGGNPLKYGPYRIIRILGREIPDWYNSWDWIVDTGAAACLVVDYLEAYQKTQNADYKDLAILLAEYILRLKDADGGIRYGPRGMFHDPEPKSDFYWNLKSAEQNERCLYAFEALYQVTADEQYNQAANQIKNWLKSIYDNQVHLYHSAATYSQGRWLKSDWGYVATDVMAFAPLEMMFSDPYFGTTQEQRDAEVDAMFAAIEARTAFLHSPGRPYFFRFSVSQQTNDYGSVEVSAQMALAYLQASQIYSSRFNSVKAQEYLDKYNTLVTSLSGYFFNPIDDPQAKVAPYASYIDGRPAGGVSTGTGYYTYNCQAALASAYYAFAKAGYLPHKLGGGSGIPQTGCTLNMSGVPWYPNMAYRSTGAAVAQMILNYIRQGAGATLLDQNTVYEYARAPAAFGPDLTPDEMNRVLGHFDPYDELVFNWADEYDNEPDGNPFQGYNFSVDTYDAFSDPNAIDEYIRDICHWMAFTVTKEDWWQDAELVAFPNTPVAVPLYGDYNHWVVIKGFAASDNPCPEPHTNPFNTPDFSVYGFWIKDPLISGIGQDTYKTTAECLSTYFLPLFTGDDYQGKFVQVAEPPLRLSAAQVHIPKPLPDLANLEFMGIKNNLRPQYYPNSSKLMGLQANALVVSEPFIKKQSWQEVIDPHLLSDPDCVEAFTATKRGTPVLVKRLDKENANYYLLPFSKKRIANSRLVSGVVILDAKDGHFKEASWSKIPERFLNTDKEKAVFLVRRFVVNELQEKLRKIPKYPAKIYLRQLLDLYFKYNRLFSYVNRARTELLWQPHSFSPSPYKPYWKVDANGYIWYVTQEGKVIPQANPVAIK